MTSELISDAGNDVGTGPTGGPWTGGGYAAMSRWAPDVAAQVMDLGRLKLVAVDDELISDPRVAAFADQFCIDVTGVDEGLRTALTEAAGREVFAVVQLVYIADFWPRLRSVLDAVFEMQPWPAPEPVRVEDIWVPLEELMKAVARLSALDPTLTELVRLRGARQHDCRLCRSRRSVAALDAGADETMFEAVDEHATSDLPAATRAALALTDAMIWTPYTIPAEVVAAVRAHLTPAQAVEVALDVTRNAANKIAVALAADAPEVTDGVQLFTTDADGVLTTLPT